MTLGPDYSVLVEANKEKIKQLIEADRVDVLILDLDTAYTSIGEPLAFLAKIKGSRVPIVVMADDNRRCTAMELVGHVYTIIFANLHLSSN